MENNFPSICLGSLLAHSSNKKPSSKQNKTSLIARIASMYINERDPGKLSNFLKWPKPSHKVRC